MAASFLPLRSVCWTPPGCFFFALSCAFPIAASLRGAAHGQVHDCARLLANPGSAATGAYSRRRLPHAFSLFSSQQACQSQELVFGLFILPFCPLLIPEPGARRRIYAHSLIQFPIRLHRFPNQKTRKSNKISIFAPFAFYQSLADCTPKYNLISALACSARLPTIHRLRPCNTRFSLEETKTLQRPTPQWLLSSSTLLSVPLPIARRSTCSAPGTTTPDNYRFPKIHPRLAVGKARSVSKDRHSNKANDTGITTSSMAIMFPMIQLVSLSQSRRPAAS